MSEGTQPIPRPGHPGAVVVICDDPNTLRALTRYLTISPYVVVSCRNTDEAIQYVREGNVQVLVCDVVAHDLSIFELLRTTKQHDPDLPVVLVTDRPNIKAATKAIDRGATVILLKPIEQHVFLGAVQHAARLHQLAQARRLAISHFDSAWQEDEYSGIDSHFQRALKRLWLAFQPIVRASDRTIYGYEALIRSDEPALGNPAQMSSAAERSGAVVQLGRAVRAKAASAVIAADYSFALFMRLHPEDLLDPDLVNAHAVLTPIAGRVVLEIGEQAAISDGVKARDQAIKLRAMGFRIAIANYGAGQATLRNFALLEPEFVKLDSGLIRGIDLSSAKRKLVTSIATISRDMGCFVVADGIETVGERDAAVDLGCDLLQGSGLARPGPAFPEVGWK